MDRQPVSIDRKALAQSQEDFLGLLLENSAVVLPLLSKPDHVLEATNDCIVTFLEEGLLPLMRDEVDIDLAAVLQLANEFIQRFQQEHPQDFDLANPFYLVELSANTLFQLMILYTVKGRHSDEDQTTLFLIDKAYDVVEYIVENRLDNNEVI